MFQSITKIKRPFLTDDLCVKVALQLNYVPVTQNIQISQQKTEQKYFNEHSLLSSRCGECLFKFLVFTLFSYLNLNLH